MISGTFRPFALQGTWSEFLRLLVFAPLVSLLYGQAGWSIQTSCCFELDEAYFGYKKLNYNEAGRQENQVLVAVSTDDKKKHPLFVKMRAVYRLTAEVAIDFVLSHFDENCLVQTDGLNIYSALRIM